jgi:hypothetical protein
MPWCWSWIMRHEGSSHWERGEIGQIEEEESPWLRSVFPTTSLSKWLG